MLKRAIKEYWSDLVLNNLAASPSASVVLSEDSMYWAGLPTDLAVNIGQPSKIEIPTNNKNISII